MELSRSVAAKPVASLEHASSDELVFRRTNALMTRPPLLLLLSTCAGEPSGISGASSSRGGMLGSKDDTSCRERRVGFDAGADGIAKVLPTAPAQALTAARAAPCNSEPFNAAHGLAALGLLHMPWRDV